MLSEYLVWYFLDIRKIDFTFDEGHKISTLAWGKIKKLLKKVKKIHYLILQPAAVNFPHGKPWGFKNKYNFEHSGPMLVI